LQDQLQAEVNSGAIAPSDQSALSSALNNISSSLQAGQASASITANTAPGDLPSKINTLIAGQVSSGNLTSDQATELQRVFKAAFANGGGAPGGAVAPSGASTPAIADGPGRAGGAQHGGHHHGGHGGPPPADSSTSTDSSTGSASDILQQFLQSLQNSQATSSPSTYGATGSPDAGSSASPPASPLLVNYRT
jgi:hypothetical protein